MFHNTKTNTLTTLSFQYLLWTTKTLSVCGMAECWALSPRLWQLGQQKVMASKKLRMLDLPGWLGYRKMPTLPITKDETLLRHLELKLEQIPDSFKSVHEEREVHTVPLQSGPQNLSGRHCFRFWSLCNNVSSMVHLQKCILDEIIAIVSPPTTHQTAELAESLNRTCWAAFTIRCCTGNFYPGGTWIDTSNMHLYIVFHNH